MVYVLDGADTETETEAAELEEEDEEPEAEGGGVGIVVRAPFTLMVPPLANIGKENVSDCTVIGSPPGVIV